MIPRFDIGSRENRLFSRLNVWPPRKKLLESRIKIRSSGRELLVLWVQIRPPWWKLLVIGVHVWPRGMADVVVTVFQVMPLRWYCLVPRAGVMTKGEWLIPKVDSELFRWKGRIPEVLISSLRRYGLVPGLRFIPGWRDRVVSRVKVVPLGGKCLVFWV